MFAEGLLRLPDKLSVEIDDGICSMTAQGEETWKVQDVTVHLEITPPRMDIWLEAPAAPVRRIFVRWQMLVLPGWRFLGDHWERGYGDLEWRGIVPERVMPWYVLAYDGEKTDAFGVEIAPSALAYWQVDSGGVRLVLDVRCGGKGVLLGERRLHTATVVVRDGREKESPFAAAQAFCKQMSADPRLPSHPIYGSNDWYYSYGRSTHRTMLDDARITADLSPVSENPPYVVIDGGWQAGGKGDGDIDSGDRTRGNERFPDMPGLADALKGLGVRPGIWERPLPANPDTSPSLLLEPPKGAVYAHVPMLDPSVPEALAIIAADTHRLVEWGYRLIKHDFTTVDILGRWGFDLGADLTAGNWAFHDRTRTTAEIIRSLYQTIRDAAGDAIIIGCNTIGHLSAGLVELQRTGDDTSGREWERTRKMGVNTLAFRMPQHNAFYACDADCVGLTNQIPWELNRQWLELLARSGTPLFVSADPSALGPEQKRALAESYARAARRQSCAIPEDWLNTTCPTCWNLGGEQTMFNWFL